MRLPLSQCEPSNLTPTTLQKLPIGSLTYSAGCAAKGADPYSTKALLHRILHLIIDHLLLHSCEFVDQLLTLGLFIHHGYVQIHNHSLVILKLHLLILKLLPQIDQLVIALVQTVLNCGLLLIDFRILFLHRG